MTAVVACPFIPISFNMYSHRAAQGVIYADLLKHMGVTDLEVYMSKPSVQGEGANEANKTEDFNRYDTMYMYHGNDWKADNKDVNLFGGVKDFPHGYNTRNISRFRGKLYSIVLPMPQYALFLKKKIDGQIARHGTEKVLKEFLEIDWDNFERMCNNAEVIDPWVYDWEGHVAGDSHAICMYRPGYNVNSVPFKTLHGALKMGLESFIRPNPNVKHVEFYFGNIDIRHHIMRQPDWQQSIRDLVDEYIKQMVALPYERKTIYELLPIENERRTIPQSGWFQGTPFFGTWAERNEARKYFNSYAETRATISGIEFRKWITPEFYNEEGEMDFKVMERPKSVHLSRASYPYWQGQEYNGLEKKLTVEDFFS